MRPNRGFADTGRRGEFVESNSTGAVHVELPSSTMIANGASGSVSGRCLNTAESALCGHRAVQKINNYDEGACLR